MLYKLRILPGYRPKCKVISVGNITMGGTGKTPLVEWVVKFLVKNNKRPGIIIRGYGRPKHKNPDSGRNKGSYLESGDEASMLKETLGGINISVGRDKIKSARELERLNCNPLVLDDGFQHWRLRRDLDIVAIDCSNPIFDQKLIPLGRLREPISSLKRAHVFVLTKTDLSQGAFHMRTRLREINSEATIVSSVYKPVCFHDLKTDECFSTDSPSFKGIPILILSGIANPVYFDKMLSSLRLSIKRELVFPDHYEYKRRDIESIKSLAGEMRTNRIITTHKDAVRLKRFLKFMNKIEIFYLEIELEITKGEEEFRNRILSVSNS
ncbi:tetraacyldisaccharide 4'-kinase [Candidatus Omnitrophota bacterium]